MYMDLGLATLKSVSFYLPRNVSTLNQFRKFYPVARLCVNTLLATKVTLITDGILFGTLRVKTAGEQHRKGMVCVNPSLKRQGNSRGTAWYV
jgi:hypothetical protein